MKRGIIIILIFTFLIGLCILEEAYLKANLEKLNEKSIELLELVENSENVNTQEINKKVIELNEFWKETEAYFCLVVNHINMEEAGEQISKIEMLSKLNKKEELLVEVNLLVYFSESYQHIIVPHIQNIL